MDDSLLLLLGLYMVYSIGHFFVIQHTKPWAKRTTYEKVVTGVAMFSVFSILYA